MTDVEERRQSARRRASRPTAHSSALDSLRAAREGRENRVEQYEDNADEVYDEVTEEEYQQLVRKRQQADDFVVDDDGLGYVDDGEEFIERVDGEGDGKGGIGNGRKGVNGKINTDALRRKARKLNQLGDEIPQAGGIKKFLRTGNSTTVGPSSLSRTAVGGPARGGGGLNLDDMLSDLTSNPIANLASGNGFDSKSAASKRSKGLTTPQSSRFRRSPISGSVPLANAVPRGHASLVGGDSARRSSVPSSWTVRDYEDTEAGGIEEDDFRVAMDSGGVDIPGGSAEEEEDVAMHDGDKLLEDKMSGPAKQAEAGDAGSGGVEKVPVVSQETEVDKTLVAPEPVEDSAAVAKPRSRFARMKEANNIAVTAAAEAVLRPKPEVTDVLQPMGQGPDVGKGGVVRNNYMPSLDFQGPQYELSEAPVTPAGSIPNTSSWLHKDENGECMRIFWLDATEQNGTIYLIGKVAVPSAGNGKTTYLSACVAVHGIEREVLVLPRLLEGQDGDVDGPKRADIATVYNEMGTVLIPKVIPRNSRGEQFRCKPVMRKYAFGDVTVPRDETQYLKIKYPARYPALSEDVCENGGETFQAIFGARTPLIESFLIKRKLMGPCWVTVRNPKINDAPVSWCKVEVAVQSPKSITRLLAEEVVQGPEDVPQSPVVSTPTVPKASPATTGKLPPPPPVVTMSLSMKTVVSPRTHTHEVVALSALVHREVRLDGASDEDGKKMSAWIGIRPLGQSAGEEFPKVFPHDLRSEAKAAEMAARRAGKGVVPIQTMPNERALLSLFFQKLQQEDPDVLVAHNLMGFDFDILLSRAVYLKLATWSKIGRLRRNKPPKAYSSSHGMKGVGGSFNANIAAGRLLCDTYLSAKEFLRETTYSLTHLAGTQLKAFRNGVDPADVPRFFGSARDIVQLGMHTVNDASLVQRLMFKLQVIPLSCQLTTLSGNLWTRTMRGGRAERIEYLLLHEFHKRKYVTPEKVVYGSNKEGGGGGKKSKNTASGVEHEGEGDDVKAAPPLASSGARRKKAAYTGGLVLEPKKGLYDEYILLLDFNSLYPSLIQEYNLCFTTMDWAACEMTPSAEEDIDGDGEASGGPKLPPLPAEGLEFGVLPRVIRTLVERRAVVKKMLKKEKDVARKQELDIRQKALKLTANSMYGCLGFSFSRFYAKPIAALVTAQGRESLQRTVDLAETQLGLEVIYGDTDSVMINTHSTDLKQVKDIGNQVKREVNKLYKSLELDLDGVFKSMLLLKKKKYAALVVVEHPDGTVTYDKEMKGLDLVRREWCDLSKETGKFVLDRILSGDARETVVASIHDHLETLAMSMRAGEVPVSRYVITKGLNKAPHEYPDAKSQPHVQVALSMVKAGKSVNVGHHIPYVMCNIPEAKSPAEKARHPDDVLRSDGQLEVDVEWYLNQQIVPPVSRLCEPIEGTSMAVLAEKMGLDASKFTSHVIGDGGNEQDDWAFTPTSRLPDAERFRGVVPLRMICRICHEEDDFQGVFAWDHTKPVKGPFDIKPGLLCPAPGCGAPYWGAGSEVACVSTLYQRLTLAVRGHLRVYYQTLLRCDDSSCGLRTRSAGVMGVACPARGCQGRLVREYSDKALYDQLKFYETLFDVGRAQTKVSELFNFSVEDLPVSSEHRQILSLVGRRIQDDVESSGYNWIRPSLWSSVFTSQVQPRAIKAT